MNLRFQISNMKLCTLKESSSLKYCSYMFLNSL